MNGTNHLRYFDLHMSSPPLKKLSYLHELTAKQLNEVVKYVEYGRPPSMVTSLYPAKTKIAKLTLLVAGTALGDSIIDAQKVTDYDSNNFFKGFH